MILIWPVLISTRKCGKLAQALGARKVVGVDIDDSLVRAAWKRRRTVWSLQKHSAPMEDTQANEKFGLLLKKRKRTDELSFCQPTAVQTDFFPVSCEHMFGPLPIPSQISNMDIFPHNVTFRTADWVNTEIAEDVEGYDAVLA
jgi:7SK snRNA methylphosphate capping enzyme